MNRPALRLDRGLVYYPVLSCPFATDDPASIETLQAADLEDGEVVILHGGSEVATLFRIQDEPTLEEGTLSVTLEGLTRVAVSEQNEVEGRWTAVVEPLPSQNDNGPRARDFLALVVRTILAHPDLPDPASHIYQTDLPTDTLVDISAYAAGDMDRATKLAMLAELDVEKRSELARPYWEAKSNKAASLTSRS